MKPMPLLLTLALALALAAPAAPAQDRAELERTPIVGNRELPKVLYIVPWKKPQPGALAGRPVHSVLDDALAPLDREVFRRQQRFEAQLKGAGAATDSSPSKTPGAAR